MEYSTNQLMIYFSWVHLRIQNMHAVLERLQELIKGVVHFKKKTFAYNLLTSMSSKISMSFFLQSERN